MQDRLDLSQMISLSCNWNPIAQMFKRGTRKVTISVVSSCLLSDVTICGFDESLGDGLVGLHFISSLYKGIEYWPAGKDQTNRSKDRVHDPCSWVFY